MNYSLSGDQWSVWLLTIIHLLGRNSLFIFFNLETAIKPYIKDENQKFKKSFDERRKILSGMGIKVIWYPYGEHSAVEILIKQLAEDIKNENKKSLSNELT